MKRFSIIIIFLMILTGCANNAIEDKVTSVKILAWNEKLFNEK